MRIRIIQAFVAALALTLATLTVGIGTAGADHHYYSSAVTSVDAETTGHLVTSANGFASIVNGNTAGPLSGQATAITPKQGEITPAATAAPALAHTGAETAYLAYAGLGLVAAGAVAMGSRRRSVDS